MLLSRVFNQSEITILLKLSSGQGTTRSCMGQGLDCRRGCSITSIKIQCKRAAWFLNSFFFFTIQKILHFAHAVSLPACKNHTIHHATFVLVLNDAENISLSENIAVVCVKAGTHDHTGHALFRLCTSYKPIF